MSVNERALAKELGIKAYSRMASIVSGYSLETLTLYVQQDARAVDIALAIATGAIPDVAIPIIDDHCWIQVAFLAQEHMRPLTLPFIVPRDFSLLMGVGMNEWFSLQVEGVIPVDIRVPMQKCNHLLMWLSTKGEKA
jgi:hypothetical protein